MAAPLPTNAWWQNLAVATQFARPESAIFQMPYVVLADVDAVHATQPFMVGEEEESFDKNLGLSLSAAEGLQGPQVSAWDELSLTLAWQRAGGSQLQEGMHVPLVRGSPYITAEYAGVTPRITSSQRLRSTAQSIAVDGRSTACDGRTALTGKVFAFELVPSDATWFFFAPKGTTWICQAVPFSLTAQAAFHGGAIRVGLANNCTTGIGSRHCGGAPRGRDTSAYAKLLKQHAGSYPVNASVDFSVTGDVGTVSWEWGTRSLAGWGPAALLQLAWPVHLPLLAPKLRSGAAASPFHDVRGLAVALAVEPRLASADSAGREGSSTAGAWQLRYRLFPDVGLAAPRAIAEDLRPALLRALRGGASAADDEQSLDWTKGSRWNGTAPDKDFDLPLSYRLGVGDTYYSGKMLARLARLVAIADELGEAKEPYFTRLLARLAKNLEAWLGSHAETPFIYDASWGGLVSCGCFYDDCRGQCTPHCSNRASPAEECPALQDPEMNFGNGIYNDHHFHYGYFVYSAAVLARFDPDWERRWRERLLALIRDYGNPSKEDPSFPVARHKDWFLGSSWASGLQADAKGRQQQSSAEAINSYYALYLYGASVKAPFSEDLKHFGLLLAAMEAHSADTYWHVRKGSQVYSRSYPHQVVGILWEHAAEPETWFGGDTFIASGVQLSPYTPIMEDYLKEDWVARDVEHYQAACSIDAECQHSWSWQLCLEKAVLHPHEKALACLDGLPENAFSIGNPAANGNSLTNSLHWIATRPKAGTQGMATSLAKLRLPVQWWQGPGLVPVMLALSLALAALASLFAVLRRTRWGRGSGPTPASAANLDAQAMPAAPLVGNYGFL
jgi:endo-1,3(4)-beta-glucanase